MSFSEVFGGSNIYPSNATYLPITMAVDISLNWPIEQQVGGNDIVADIIDVNATVAALSITMADARQVSTGYTALFNNVGANTVTIKDNTGATIATVAPGTVWQLYLRDNSTQGGLWRTFQFGSAVSTATAASLVGLGIKAISTTLNLALPVTNFSVTPTTLVSGDRAKFLNWTGGAGILNLPNPATAGNDWNTIVRNSGSGVLTLTPPSGTIDGAVTKLMSIGDSCIIVTDGTNFYTMSGEGGSNGSGFSYISINVAGNGTYTLSGAELNQVGYEFTGLLTGNREIVVPASTQEYWVFNNTTGAFTLGLKTAAQVGNIAVTQATRNILACDGTNVFAASDSAISFPISIAQGGTGAVTAAAARTALSVPPLSRSITGTGALTGGGDLSSDRTISMSFLGFQNLVDPNVDAISFWDDSAAKFDWLTIGTGLSITGTVLSSTGAPIVSSAAASVAAIAVGQSAYMFKAADTNRNTTTAPAADPALQFSGLPIGKYEIEGFITYFQNSAASQGIKFQLTSGFTTVNFHAYAGPDGTPPTADWQAASRIQGAANNAYNHNMGASSANGSISFKGQATCGAADTLSFDWAQESSNANNTTVLAGSWFKITRLS